MNTLYYGDNLDILKRYIKDETIDLIYLDPPFNSNQDYNVLFSETDGTKSSAQKAAFLDTWQWDHSAEIAWLSIVKDGPQNVSRLMKAYRDFLGENDMMAYLSMMSSRLLELHRVLKPTGSIYLHCDPTASHYLKLLMDSIFRNENFLNEIIWKRTFAHGSSKRYGPVHDVILFYSKTNAYVWSNYKIPHDNEYLEKYYNLVDKKTGKRFASMGLTGPGIRHGHSGKPWRGVDPTNVGRHWALPTKLVQEFGIKKETSQEVLDELDRLGYINWPEKEKGTPRLKQFVDSLEGISLPDIWNDIQPISSHAQERLGYPTQKPETLLERIIHASSAEGDIVLDPFCGCGTTIAVAQRLKRQWIGIDITHLSITLMKNRLLTAFGEKYNEKNQKVPVAEYQVIGEPEDMAGAQELAKTNPYQFQWWALGLVGARKAEGKKGADQGIDGRLLFYNQYISKMQDIIIQIKGGHVTSQYVRDLRGVIEREVAQIGVLISMEEPSAPMKKEAVTAGYFELTEKHKYPKIQLLTIEELLNGKKIDYPLMMENLTLKKAPRVFLQKENANQQEFPIE